MRRMAWSPKNLQRIWIIFCCIIRFSVFLDDLSSIFKYIIVIYHIKRNMCCYEMIGNVELWLAGDASVFGLPTCSPFLIALKKIEVSCTAEIPWNQTNSNISPLELRGKPWGPTSWLWYLNPPNSIKEIACGIQTYTNGQLNPSYHWMISSQSWPHTQRLYC